MIFYITFFSLIIPFYFHFLLFQFSSGIIFFLLFSLCIIYTNQLNISFKFFFSLSLVMSSFLFSLLRYLLSSIIISLILITVFLYTFFPSSPITFHLIFLIYFTSLPFFLYNLLYLLLFPFFTQVTSS